MTRLRTLGVDVVGLARVCGPSVAARWVAGIPLRVRQVMRTGNLQAADRAMGDGPFTVALRAPDSTFRISGPAAFGGIRELYARDVYCRHLWPPAALDDTILDLGANMGNFSALVLGSDPRVRVVAVEPSRSLNARLVNSLGLNEGFLPRVQLIHAFVGLPSLPQKRAIANDPNYTDAEWITEDELIRRAGLRRIGLLKCDIEGSEFGLLGPHSRLLAMTAALACEVHAFAGDVPGFVAGIRESGFRLDSVRPAPDGSATLFATRVADRS